MNWILLLFVLLTFIIIIAWSGKYHLSIGLFAFFLIASTIVFWLDITSPLQIQL